MKANSENISTKVYRNSERRMFCRRYRVPLALTLALLIGTALVSPVLAAAPRIIMIYGPPLAQPIVLSDWVENGRFMGSITEGSNITSEELTGRPYLELAFFWGAEWDQYVKEGKPLAALRPEQANQHGRFYPAFNHAASVVRFDSIPGPGPLTRRIDLTGIEILARYGIPTRLETSPSATPTSPQDTPAWLIGGAAILFLSGTAIVLRRWRKVRLR